MNQIQTVVEKFVNDLSSLITAEARDRVLGSLGDVPKNGHSTKRPRPPVTASPKKARKKSPIQLCPAPGCTGRAAPVFSMLCAKHKGTNKKQVAKWRTARRRASEKKAGKK